MVGNQVLAVAGAPESTIRLEGGGDQGGSHCPVQDSYLIRSFLSKIIIVDRLPCCWKGRLFYEPCKDSFQQYFGTNVSLNGTSLMAARFKKFMWISNDQSTGDMLNQA